MIDFAFGGNEVVKNPVSRSVRKASNCGPRRFPDRAVALLVEMTYIVAQMDVI